MSSVEKLVHRSRVIVNIVGVIIVEQSLGAVFENRLEIDARIISSVHMLNEGLIESHLLAANLCNLLLGTVFGH